MSAKFMNASDDKQSKVVEVIFNIDSCNFYIILGKHQHFFPSKYFYALHVTPERAFIVQNWSFSVGDRVLR